MERRGQTEADLQKGTETKKLSAKMTLDLSRFFVFVFEKLVFLGPTQGQETCEVVSKGNGEWSCVSNGVRSGPSSHEEHSSAGPPRIHLSICFLMVFGILSALIASLLSTLSVSI